MLILWVIKATGTVGLADVIHPKIEEDFSGENVVDKWDQVDRWVKKNTVIMLEKVKGKNISLEQLMS